MSELARLLLLVAIAGSAVTFMGSAAIWFTDEERSLRRALRHVLKGDPEATIVARGRGRGAGFSFATGLAAVAWDKGAWCLIYRIDELMGAELLVDGQVSGRVFRGEARRALDHVAPQAQRVTLRLIFDDPRHPDFDLDLWQAGDEQRRESSSPGDAVQEANRWLARCEAIVRRPQAPRVQTVRPEPVVPEPPPVTPRRAASPAPPAAELDEDEFDAIDADLGDDLPFDDDVPWAPDPPPRRPPPPPAPTYKPVSKATPRPETRQDELPFDLDD
jgi:hypothetical protein